MSFKVIDTDQRVDNVSLSLLDGSSGMPAPVIVAHDDKATRELAVAALIAAGLTAVGFHDLMAALDAVEDESRVRVLVARIDFGAGKLNGVALARMRKL
jgi:DNA-binding NtrC family response regulator